MIIYFAETLPKNNVNLEGSIRVGIASINIRIKPENNRILKIKDLKNCINNLLDFLYFDFS